jgi:hypothetical protein
MLFAFVLDTSNNNPRIPNVYFCLRWTSHKYTLSFVVISGLHPPPDAINLIFVNFRLFI